MCTKSLLCCFSLLAACGADDRQGVLTVTAYGESFIEGDRVVLTWSNRLPGRRDDGTHYDVPGISLLTYAGDGRFSYEEDIMNMVHLFEVIAESGYQGYVAHEYTPLRDPIESLVQAVKTCDV